MVKRTRQLLAVWISLVIAVSSFGYQNPDAVAGAAGGAADGAPMSGTELEALVAPIALYPDALVAQILAAATFPDQVAVADYWLQQNRQFTGTSLMQAVNKQSWDSSVKALTQFPSVLDNLAKNLTWTSSLGEAYHNQPAEVMAAVQAAARQSQGCGKSQVDSSNHSRTTIAADHRHPTRQPAGRICPGIQSGGNLWHALRHSGIYRRRRGGRWRDRLRRRHRPRRARRRRLLRLGMEFLEL